MRDLRHALAILTEPRRDRLESAWSADVVARGLAYLRRAARVDGLACGKAGRPRGLSAEIPRSVRGVWLEAFDEAVAHRERVRGRPAPDELSA